MNLMEVVCLFPLFYSVWEYCIGNMVSLFFPRKFRTQSKDCDTVGSLTAEKKKQPEENFLPGKYLSGTLEI